MNKFSYPGSELEIFAEASNWKAYYKEIIHPYLGDEVLEVGAGLGATTAAFCNGDGRWVCLEPDASLAGRIANLIADGRLPSACQVVTGTIQNLSADECFDTILYIDVLEHIADDSNEVRRASHHLKDGGFFVVLSPAHQRLYTRFDAEIGHYRRYSKRTLSALIPPGLTQCKLIYVDSVGGIASLANRHLLHREMPSRKQISFWDKRMIPLSRFLDPLLRYKIGKSIIGVWQKVVDTSVDLAPLGKTITPRAPFKADTDMNTKKGFRSSDRTINPSSNAQTKFTARNSAARSRTLRVDGALC